MNNFDGVPWSIFEEEFLARNRYASIKFIAVQLGRTEKSVKCKKTRMGLAEHIHELWTPMELIVLNGGVDPTGRSKEACRRKRRRLRDARKKSNRGTPG